MKKMNVCYASSDEYSQYTCISMISLLENNSNLIECVYLLNFGIKDSNLQIIIKCLDKYHCKIKIIDALKEMGLLIKEIGLELFDGSYATYSRALIDKLITDTDEKVLYIDSDTVVDSSLLELANLDLQSKNKAYAAVIGANQYIFKNSELCLDNGNKTYFACGVVLYDMHIWKTLKCTEQIVEYIKKNKGFQYADQTVINNVINEDYVMPIHPKYNYWGHLFQGKRKYFEMSRGGFWSSNVIQEASVSPIIIHYKGLIAHPWLTGSISSLKDRYQYYRSLSPWSGCEEKSIYYDEKKGYETSEQKKLMRSTLIYLRLPVLGMLTIDLLRKIKWKFLRRKSI